MNLNELNETLQRLIITGKLTPKYSRMRQMNTMTQYLPIIMDEQQDNFVNFQIILALKKNIPILTFNPGVILWNGFIFKRHGKRNRYKCRHKGCKYSLIHNEQDHIIYWSNKMHHNHSNCPNNHVVHETNGCNSCTDKKYKHILIFQLLKIELLTMVSKEVDPHTNTPKRLYNNLIKKYAYKIPLLDLSRFSSYISIHKNLYKHKKITNKLTSLNTHDYFQNKFSSTLIQYAPLRSSRCKLKNKLKWKIKGQSLLFTHYDLLRIFFSAVAIGADGTFNIRPQFIKINGGRFKPHQQVFKVYAFYQYKSRDGGYVVKSYLIAIALLESKDTDIYKWLYTQLLTWGDQFGLIDHMNFEQYICDYEKSQRNGFSYAMNAEYVCHTEISGEEYHWKSAIYMNIGRKGLSRFYIKTKTSETYDSIFRKHVELIFNLCHIPHQLVKQFAIKICKSLWIHVLYTHDKEDKKHFLSFIYYILHGWCECDKKLIKKKLDLRGYQRIYINKLRCPQIERIEQWNLYGKVIRNNNSIEVNNKHDRIKLGYYPTIDHFMLVYLFLFDDTIRNYHSDKTKQFLPKTKSKSLIRKENLLRVYQDINMDWETFKIFSAKLTFIKYYHDTNKYFRDKNDEKDDCACDDEILFNDIILENINDQREILTVSAGSEESDELDSQYYELPFGEETFDMNREPWFRHSDQESPSTNQQETTESNPPKPFNSSPNISTVNNCEPPCKRRKLTRLCKSRLQNNVPNPYNVSYNSADESEFEDDMERKNEYKAIMNIISKYKFYINKLAAFISDTELKEWEKFQYEQHDLYDWKQQLEYIQTKINDLNDPDLQLIDIANNSDESHDVLNQLNDSNHNKNIDTANQLNDLHDVVNQLDDNNKLDNFVNELNNDKEKLKKFRKDLDAINDYLTQLEANNPDKNFNNKLDNFVKDLNNDNEKSKKILEDLDGIMDYLTQLENYNLNKNSNNKIENFVKELSNDREKLYQFVKDLYDIDHIISQLEVKSLNKDSAHKEQNKNTLDYIIPINQPDDQTDQNPVQHLNTNNNLADYSTDYLSYSLSDGNSTSVFDKTTHDTDACYYSLSETCHQNDCTDFEIEISDYY